MRNRAEQQSSGTQPELAAFQQLYQRHYPLVYGYLRARLLDAHDADDLCQETFYRTFRTMERMEAGRVEQPWLIGIARNVLREHVARVRRRKEICWAELCLELEATIAPEGLYEDMLPLLPQCMGQLGDSARDALRQHYMAGLKLQQIAELLGRTLGAVKVLMVRARQALKMCIRSRMEGRSR